MKTLIVKNNWMPQDIVPHGWGNGYVLIPKDSILYGVDYDTLNTTIDVHAGLTYAQSVQEEDHMHFTGITKEDIGKWMVGFDTAHSMDTLKNWPKERVQEEADKLLKQLQEYEKRKEA